MLIISILSAVFLFLLGAALIGEGLFVLQWDGIFGIGLTVSGLLCMAIAYNVSPFYFYMEG